MLFRTIVLTSLLWISALDAKTARSTDGKEMFLTCTTGFSIQINSVYYGSTGIRPACSDPNAKTIVENLANGAESYTLIVSDSVFTTTTCTAYGETCIVRYSCTSDKKTATARQGRSVTLTCPSGNYIVVSRATYAFRSTCSDADAFSIVRTACNDKNTCTIDATDSTFPSSTCTSQSESLSISYLCSVATGAIFTRWGYNECPSTANLLYSGTMGGSGSGGQRGSGSTFLCLPNDPDTTGASSTDETDNAQLFGQELVLDTADTSSPISVSYNSDVIRCAVCQLQSSMTVFTFPGKNVCPSAWNVEYKGYLIAKDVSTGSAKSYECLDSSGGANAFTTVLSATGVGGVSIVESACGAGLCNYYTSNAEVTCAVCSK